VRETSLRHPGQFLVGGAACAILCALPTFVLAQAAPQVGPPTTPQASPAAVAPQPTAAPLPAPQAAPLLTIPRMLDRPLGLEEGPRVLVTSFKLTNAVDHPALGLYVAALNAKLATAVKAQPAEVYTINQLQQIATGLADDYHHAGLILAQIIVPAQEIHDGVVELRVLEGKLEAVKVEGNHHNRSGALAAPFSSLIGQSFEQRATDAALLRLTEYPGLSVFGVVTPGTAVGSSDLVLRVQREQPIEVNLGLDNFGNKLSGEDRGNIALAWNSPLGLGDRLSVFGLHALTTGDSDAHTTYGGADYRIPFFAARSAVDVSYSVNDYAVGQSLGITGRVYTGLFTFHQEFYRSRAGVVYGELSVADKRADITFPTGGPGEEHVDDFSALFGTRFSDGAHGFNDLSVSFLHGTVASPGAGEVLPRKGEDTSYDLVAYHLQRQQALIRYMTLVGTVGGQWSSNALSTLDQLALGGPTSARAFEVAAYVADEGTYGSLELLIGAPGFASHPAFSGKNWGDLLQLSFFGDIAHGQTNAGAAGQATVFAPETMKDWGVGLQFNLPDRVYARVSWADQIAPATFFTQQDSRSSRVYASLGIHF